MLPYNQFIDIHCHPTMKPYGKSFARDGSNKGQSPNPRSKTSLWNYDPPTFTDKLINNIASLTKFRQSDFSSSLFGETGIMFVCLYPPEQGFFKTKLGNTLSDLALDLVTGLGKPRINYLQSNCDYFEDLLNEYHFLQSHENKIVRIKKKNATYKIITKSSDLSHNTILADRTIFVVITIEGAHSFFSGWNFDKKEPLNSDEEVLANIDRVKSWTHKPLFISLAHHFYNGICGHSLSMEKFLRKFIEQEYGSNFGVTRLGEKVIHRLLDKNSGRILIDVKHMNLKNRFWYYNLLDSDYASENIPIVVSHGAVNGYKNAHGSTTFPGSPDLFYKRDINFYDDELLRIARSNGLFGIQIDERRIASNVMLWSLSGKFRNKELLFHFSKLVWNQIEHVAKVLDNSGFPAWDTVCLGSDYDGIVNPIPGYWTQEDIQHLDDNLLIHANNFLKKYPLSQKAEPEEVIFKFKCGNALQFLKRNY
jgi:microsomal dipeptidase-like Zn-dependent dipeptidase